MWQLSRLPKFLKEDAGEADDSWSCVRVGRSKAFTFQGKKLVPCHVSLM